MNNTFNPLVSIIVPAYNCEVTISETIESLFNQKYKNIEIIVVDDGSIDNTKSVLSQFGANIKIINQENAGVASARNSGIICAAGDIIAFCDADDLWSECKLIDQVMHLLENPDIDMVYSDWWVWYPDNNGLFSIPSGFNLPNDDRYNIDTNHSGWIYHKLLLDCLCLTSTVLIRKTVIEKVGLFKESLKCGEDYDYWLRVSQNSKINKLNSKYVLYRQHPQSITRKPNQINYEYEVLKLAIQKWGLRNRNGETINKKKLKYRFAKLHFDFAYIHFEAGNYAIAKNYFMYALLERPFWHLSWYYLFLSMLHILMPRS